MNRKLKDCFLSLQNIIFRLMKRVKFPNYIRNLPPNIILEYLSAKDTPKIFTNSVYENICAKFYEKKQIAAILSDLSPELRKEIFQIYLCGNLGKRISSGGLKAELLKTFLVFEGTGKNTEVLFGFPDLAQNTAEFFTENLSAGSQKRNPQMFFGTFLNDFTIILNMFQNDESKVRTNGEYSQRWTDLLKERCGIGKMLTDFADLSKILDFVIDFSTGCGAKFLRDNGKMTLLSNSDELIGVVLEKITADLPKIIDEFSKTIDFSFLKMLASVGENSENWVKISENCCEEISAELDFSLKFFHWCGLAAVSNENSFKIKSENRQHFQNGHILPDFSIYIPIETNPLHLKKLLHSAKITSVDVIYHGKIDKKCVEETLAGGIGEKEIIGILQIWNAPVSLQKTISEWIYSFQRAFADLPYIAFRNDIAPNISTYSDLKDKLLPIENYTFFKVKSGEEKNVFETLERFGFDLRKVREKISLPLENETKTRETKEEFNQNPQLPTKKDDYIFVRRAN